MQEGGRGERPQVRESSGIVPCKMQCGNFCGVLFALFRPAHKKSVSTGCESNTYNSVAWAKPNTQLNCHEMDRG